MDRIEQFRRHGLFDARVPRYTSYPPANHFSQNTGRLHQADWLQSVQQGSEVSVYVHIPFCKRLCWFCACRTQGTKTLRPVETYIEVLREEIRNVRNALPKSVRMARLHLGGGTPTILTPTLMTVLLREIYATFALGEDFAFSVEIDPTEAPKPLLQTLVDHGLSRASIGVQDFSTKVQNAIGRYQSVEQTMDVVRFLRDAGVRSLNLDLLYGLPHQTAQSFHETLGQVADLQPDRLAIYGYAHVPWMSKRQVMIKADNLPDALARFELAEQAAGFFTAEGYDSIGIDHFAKPSDSLSLTQKQGLLRRNFQGYTDDQNTTLIGFGASAISKFAGGYVQNAAATSAYQDCITKTGFAGYKGYRMTEVDTLIARMVEDLMCRFSFETKALTQAFPDYSAFIRQTSIALMMRFPDVLYIAKGGLKLRPTAKPLVRIIANHIDSFAAKSKAHSAAI